MDARTQHRRSWARSFDEGPPVRWTRTRALLAVAAAAVVLAGLGIVGAWYLIGALTGHPLVAGPGPATVPASASPVSPRVGDGATAGEADGPAARDALAAAPMVSVPAAAAQPAPLVIPSVAPIVLPAATGTDPHAVATGYPQTPQGALAQLAAIDQAAFSVASISQPQQVITAWSTPGGPDAQSWSGVKGMAALLSGLQGSADAGTAQVRLTPLMGLIKGSIGADFVVACVDSEVSATTAVADSAGSARVGEADCERMVWVGDRWRIGPGPEPAPGPSTWPGSQAAFDAGYRELSRG